MQRHFDQEFDFLKKRILMMGEQVQIAVEASLKGLMERDSKYFQKVHETEHRINTAHREVDEACLGLLARQSPLGSDLRFVFSVIKINTDLERMGDQAVNIAHNSEHYLKHPSLKPLIDIPRMAQEAEEMIREALRSFVERDVELAKTVLAKDDSVDELKDRIFKDLSALIKQNPVGVDPALNLILIARNLERLGDHATNIAEETIFGVSGKDIRHGFHESA